METTESTIKKPTTFIEQVNILKSRNLQIEEEEKAIETLKRINYYRLSAYMLSFKSSDRFYDGVSFSDVYNLYSKLGGKKSPPSQRYRVPPAFCRIPANGII
jgi:abortive infection bacteriophage resistance protein